MPSERRSPLAFLLLGLLTAGPMNAYRMHRFLLDTDKTDVVNIASRNSVYQSLSALERDGLVEVESQGRRDSTEYRLTAQGRVGLDAWLAETISAPGREYPTFPAALATASLLAPSQLADYLEARLERLRERLSEPTPEQVMDAAGIPRIYVLEDEYTRSQAVAEHDWLTATITQLRDGEFTWRTDPHDWDEHRPPGEEG
jgi:DNA-binding PadR family transcriptional regulator